MHFALNFVFHYCTSKKVMFYFVVFFSLCFNHDYSRLTLSMASTILALPAWTATVLMVVVEGCSDSSETSADASPGVAC